MADSIKYVLDESRIPRDWYNLLADLPSPPPPVLHPGTLEPVGPDDLAPLFPMSLIAQEVSTDREIEIPEPVRDVYRQWRPTPAVPGASAREGAEDAGADLLQVRGRQPGRQSQAQHGGRAGLLQQGGGRQEDRDRDRRRAVGLRARVRRRALRHRDSGVHGPGLVQPEAVSSRLHGDVRRALRREPVDGDQFRPAGPRRVAGQQRQPGHRDLRGGRDRGQPRRYEVRARLGAESRAAAPDRHRPGSDPQMEWQTTTRYRRRLHGRRLEFRGHRVPVHRRRSCAAARRSG